MAPLAPLESVTVGDASLVPKLSSEVLLALVRRKLSDWESQFLKENGREAEKEDAYASDKMAALYRKYAQLKATVDKKKATLVANDSRQNASSHDPLKSGPFTTCNSGQSSKPPSKSKNREGAASQGRKAGRPPLKDRSNLRGTEAIRKAGVSEAKQRGGLPKEMLIGSTGLVTARGGPSFSSMSNQASIGDRGRGNVPSDTPLDKDLEQCQDVLAGHTQDATAPSCQGDSKQLEQRHQTALDSHPIRTEELRAATNLKAQAEPGVESMSWQIAQDQVRRTGFYAGSRFLSKKQGLLRGFTHRAPEEGQGAEPVQASNSPEPEASDLGNIRSAEGKTDGCSQRAASVRGTVHLGLGQPDECGTERGLRDEGAISTEMKEAPSDVAGAKAEMDKLLEQVPKLREGEGTRSGHVLRQHTNAEAAAKAEPESNGKNHLECQDGMTRGYNPEPNNGLAANAALEAKLATLTVPFLKQHLQGRCLSCKGRKQELVTRLVEALVSEGVPANWEESLHIDGAQGWGKPAQALKRRAKPASPSQRKEKRDRNIGDAKERRKGGAKRKRLPSATWEEEVSPETGGPDCGERSVRELRLRERQTSEGIAYKALGSECGTESEKGFNSDGLSDSDDDYKPQAANDEEQVEDDAPGSTSEDEIDLVADAPKRKRKNGQAEEGVDKKRKRNAASEDEPGSSRGAKRSRTETGAADKKGARDQRKSTKKRRDLQAVGWGGPVRVRKAANGGQAKASAVGLPVRDNFVRQTLNGRGGGRKRFTNGNRAAFRSKSGSRPFKRNWGKSRRGGKNWVKQGGAYRTENADEEAGQKGLFKDEGWLPSNAEGIEEAVTDPSDRPVAHPIKLATAPAKASAFSVHEVERKESEERWQDDEETMAEVQAALAEPSESNLTAVLRRLFGFDAFREGQLAAIQRVLREESTMLVLPTGGGKSLCYQLPAFLLPSLTLVISPLVALMNDQLQHLPPCLPGALISSAQAPFESARAIARLKAGDLKVLFISPERLFSETFLNVMAGLPPVSLAVVDEAHCVSEWSHNFRPSYHRLGSVLQSRLQVQCILAMTATATPKTEAAVMSALSLPADAIIRSARVRENLRLSVSKDANKLRSLATMLKTGPCARIKSVIVYCIFQVDADRVAAHLEANGIPAKSYHSGKYGDERAKIQNLFCANKLRVVVATVAFGMGLDKSDVGAVVHYNMPRSLEHYVQEIGRAGRDGSPAHCHLFLDDADYIKLRSLVHSDGCDSTSVLRFLSKVFVSDGKDLCADPSGLECRAIPIEAAARELDMKEEVMATILSNLEVGEAHYLRVLSQLSATCSVTFHNHNPSDLAPSHPLVAAILDLCPQPKQGRFTFNVTTLASKLKEPLAVVQRELQRLQARREIMYELKDPAFCFSILAQPQDLIGLSTDIAQRMDQVEQCKVAKLDAMYAAASEAVLLPSSSSTEPAEDASLLLHERIKANFEAGEDSSVALPDIVKRGSTFLKADIKVFLRANSHAPLTGRAVARIFHGLWSPGFPYQDWCKNHFWGRHSDVNFHDIRRQATEALVEAKSRTG